MFQIFGIPSQALFGQLLLGLINGSFYALLSLGLAVIFGMLNIINFTHGAQYMMGAFAAYLLLQNFGINYWAALVICHSLFSEGLGLAAGACDHRRHRHCGTARFRGRRARHSPARHLLRHDHAGAFANDVFLRPAGQIHRRRGRYPGRAARPLCSGLVDLSSEMTMYVVAARRLRRRLSSHLPHHQFAVRRGSQGDPRERAAHHLTRLQDRTL